MTLKERLKQILKKIAGRRLRGFTDSAYGRIPVGAGAEETMKIRLTPVSGAAPSVLHTSGNRCATRVGYDHSE